MRSVCRHSDVWPTPYLSSNGHAKSGDVCSGTGGRGDEDPVKGIKFEALHHGPSHGTGSQFRHLVDGIAATIKEVTLIPAHWVR